MVGGAVRDCNVNSVSGGTSGGYRYGITHGIHWDNAGKNVYMSFVPETESSSRNLVLSKYDSPMLNTCHYFNRKAWVLDPSFKHWDGT